MPRANDSNRGYQTKNTICVRLPEEMREQLDAVAEQNSVTPSDITRQALLMYLGGGDSMFAHTRQQAYVMARKMVDAMSAELPNTYEEAVARGLMEP